MKKKLKDVCDFFTGTGFPVIYQGKADGELPFYKVGDIANNVINGHVYLQSCKNYISRKIAKDIKGVIVPKDTIVFAKIGEALKLNRRAITSTECLIDNNTLGICPKNQIIRTKYFYYFLKKLKMQNLAETTTVPSVKKSTLENIIINIPPLQNQLYIENILNTTSNIISNYQEELIQLELLTKALFVEMFGDPMLNAKKWSKIPFHEVIKYANNGMSRRGNDKNGSIVLRLTELQKGYIDYANPNKILLTDIEKEKYLLFNNDLLFARVNGNPMNVGRCAEFIILDEPVYYNDHIIRVRVDAKKLNSCFANILFNSKYGKKELSNKIKTSAGQYTISQDGIGAVQIILPPIKLQEKFADSIKQIDKHKLLIID